VNRLGRLDAVIHNAGVYTGRRVLPVNVVASYLLSALIDRPQRLVYLSSSEHRSGRPSLTGIDWSGRRTTGSYPDSKLFVTTLTVAVARRWAEVFSNAVDPGWVPTKMGGPGAPGNLRLGHLTQEWLATSDDPEARTPAATGITSAGPSRIPPSVTGGSRTNCSRTWLASPLRASSDSCRIALSWSCETVVADGDLLGQAHVSTMLSMHKRS
jgi:NAD(P)-dependent dehydrogenase (short-subunit alcohol dehydrogenase family)